jgi:hypothetical protein
MFTNKTMNHVKPLGKLYLSVSTERATKIQTLDCFSYVIEHVKLLRGDYYASE